MRGSESVTKRCVIHDDNKTMDAYHRVIMTETPFSLHTVSQRFCLIKVQTEINYV